MNLAAVRVKNYRCIEDSGWVSIDDLACLIGRNESGKTAFLKALEMLNPAARTEEFDPYRDYPRQDWPEYNQRHDEDPDVVVSARLEVTDAEREGIAEEYGVDLLADAPVVVRRDYANERHWEIEFDEAACVEYARDAHDFAETVESALDEATSFADLPDYGEEFDGPYDAVCSEMGGEPTAVLTDTLVDEWFEPGLPEFQYVSEYATIDGTIEIDALLDRRDEEALTPGDRAFLSLLSVADLTVEDFRDVEDWRTRLTELEAASGAVTDGAMRYWSQSGDIKIDIQHTTADDTDLLELRVENRTHNVTVEFDQRSRGFRHFFSTFCQLSALKEHDENLVVMIDEPGSNLHARAKQEFLRFLKRELAGTHTLVYTTHSPFMIDPESIHRTKLVMADPIGEKNVFSDVSLADNYSRFPLRTAFEFDLMDTVLVEPQTLVVEQKADHVYLSVLSKLLEDEGVDGLDSRWTVVPIKSHENITTFVGLFGQQRLDVAALLTEEPTAQSLAGVEPATGSGQSTSGGSRPRTNRPRESTGGRSRGIADEPRGPDRRGGTERERAASRDDGGVSLEDIPLTLVPDHAPTGAGSTIEDILAESFYLELVSRTYATTLGETDGVPDRITSADLDDAGEPIVERLLAYFEAHGLANGEFDRDEPALYLQENREELAEVLDETSQRRFSRLFRDLNNVLTSFEGVESEQLSFLDAFRLG